MIFLSVYLWTHATSRFEAARRRAESGQASVEYALVMLGAGVVATLLIAWASKTDLIDELFSHVMKLVKGKTG
jgi:Flp pilus assembly pilin Flp